MNTEVTGARFCGGRDVTAFSHNIGVNYGFIVQPQIGTHHDARHDMIRFFRSNSIDYRVPHDIAYSQHTPGTGKWFLTSSVYRDWKARRFKILSCNGIPGAGKTVMASLAVENLKKTFPQGIILIVYNNHLTQDIQTAHLIMLNFLSQILESRETSSAQIRVLYDEYRDRLEVLPRYDLVKAVLLQELSTRMAFIMVDALDEYRPDNWSESQELVHELAALGCQLLITSRTPVSLPSNSFQVCTIRASDSDISLFVGSTLSTGPVGTLLKRRQHLANTLRASISRQANGIFLACSLHIRSLQQASTIAEIRSRMSVMAGNLDSTYQDILEHIRQRNPPWALRLVYLLLVFGDVTGVEQLGVRAALQHIGSLPGLQGDIRDYTPPASVVLSHCRGLVIVVGGHSIKEDFRLSSPEHSEEANQHFQFCHTSVVEYLKKTVDPPSLLEAKLEIVHTFLRSVPWSLDTFHDHAETTPTTPTTPTTSGPLNYISSSPRPSNLEDQLSRSFPLCYHATAWRLLTSGIQDRISFLLQAFFSHPRLPWLFSVITEEDISPLDMPHYQTILLSKYGLSSLLHTHISTTRTVPLNLNACSAFGVPALLHAVEKGRRDACLILLQHGADVNYADESGLTSLMMASDLGYGAIAMDLLQRGADVSLTDEDDWTALSYALNRDHPDKEIISALLAHGAILPKPNEEGETPLMLTSYYGQTDTVALLLSHGAQPDEMDVDCQTALMLAAAAGHHEVIELLIQHGASVNTSNKDGRTPLMLASVENQCTAAAVLLQHGANIDHVDKDGNSSLVLASFHGNLKILDLLWKGNALIDQPNIRGQTALFFASSRGLWSVASRLLLRGAEVNRTDLSGWTPLMHTLFAWGSWKHSLPHDNCLTLSDGEGQHFTPPLLHDLEQTARLLLDHRANTNKSYDYGLTPLILATLSHHTEITRLLLRHGADTQQVDRHGRSSLMYAARDGELETVSLLLGLPTGNTTRTRDLQISPVIAEHYPGIDQCDSSGQTALIHAVSRGHREVALLLLRQGADVNLADDSGLTPLMHALHNHDCWRCVSLLLDYGAEIHKEDKNGHTAIELTVFLGCPHISAAMISYAQGISRAIVSQESGS